ncbi:hypothetical protein AB0G57_31475, partial [Streptomyces lavendulae]
MNDIDQAGGTTTADGDAERHGERHGERDWEDLVATALLGTERRGGSPQALLGAAALRTGRPRPRGGAPAAAAPPRGRA